MGKKHKHIYEQILTFENLWLASRKARRGKRNRDEVQQFEYHLEQNLFEIQQQLKDESYNFGNYRHFTILEPKKRLISAAPYRDRVVHHALCNIIEPILDKAMIYDSYACRTGKGMHQALDRAQYFIRSKKWVLKMDIKKYFFTIDHEILLRNINSKITDNKVIKLLETILNTYNSGGEYYFPIAGDDLFTKLRNRGLPIGNLTSQLLANYYLTPMDRFIKGDIKVKYYIRYMDDFLLFADTKEELTYYKRQIVNYLESYRLLIHPEKSQVFPVKNGVKFLGFTLFERYRRIRRENLQRFKKKFASRIYNYENSNLGIDYLLMSLNAWLGFADKDKNRKLINDILENIDILHNEKGYGFKFVV